jgi:hypothetical protein
MFVCLRPRAPFRVTLETDINKLQIYCVILDVDDFARLTPYICGASLVWAWNGRHAWQSWILPGKLIEQNLIALAGALLDNRLHCETALGVVLRISTGAAKTKQIFRVRLCIKI